MQRFRRTIGLVTLSILAGVSLAGCSLVDELAHKKTSESYDSASAFEEASDVEAAWIPADATQIVIARSTSADDVSILLRSSSELDAEACVEVARSSAPSYYIKDSPDVYDHDEVFACGAWSIVRADTGWFGWTPNHPDERRAAASQ